MQEREYGTSNNMRLECRRPGRARYMYVDSAERRADRLFVRSELPVSFEDDLAKPGCGFIVVICTVPKAREADFLECMADLERAMLIEGRDDYPAFCGEMMDMLR